jgi:hypothetical protein
VIIFFSKPVFFGTTTQGDPLGKTRALIRAVASTYI